MWHAMSFLEGGSTAVARANAMLRRQLHEGGGHFWTSGMASILTRFRGRLKDDLAAALLARLAESLPDEARQRFRGYNDNFPSMAALSTVLGGQLTHDRATINAGIRTLRTGQRLLERRGFLSEYASPTYSAITLTCMAEIVELSDHEEARSIALGIEHRVWAEMAARFHPATSFIAGPHSRAYMADMCAHPHNAHVVLYQAFGDGVFVNPLNAAFPPAPGQALHGGDQMLAAHTAWQTTPTYHVPDPVLELAFEKPTPCVVEGDTEHAAMHRNVWRDRRQPVTPYAECPAGSSHLYTWIDRDAALGTSSRPFLDSYQHTACHLVYRRGAEPELPHVASLFTRYLMDDPPPNRHEHLNDAGRTLCIQHESTAMVLAWPKPAWQADADHQPDPVGVGVASLKLSLLLTCFYDQQPEAWIDDQRCEGLGGRSEDPAPVFLADGPVYLAIQPLAIDDHGRDAAVQVSVVNGFLMIDLVNYRGPKRSFSVEQLVSTRNGFVLDVARASDWPSFEAFRRGRADAHVTDRWSPPDAMRDVRVERDGLTLEMAVSPFSEGIKHRSINGRLVRAPKLRLPHGIETTLPWM